MRNKFSNQFKQNAVKQALSRDSSVGLQSLADELNVGYSTLQKWLRSARLGQLNNNDNLMTKKPQRPSDWNNSDKLELLIKCGSLDDETINQVCREQGIYPHHLDQWKAELSANTKTKSDSPRLKRELKALQKELNRKEKALAETAALLVLQKKLKHLLSEPEDV